MIYDNVKRLCKQQGLSLMSLERELGLPRSSICKWDTNEPGIWKVDKVAKKLGVPIETLLLEGSDGNAGSKT